MESSYPAPVRWNFSEVSFEEGHFPVPANHNQIGDQESELYRHTQITVL